MVYLRVGQMDEMSADCWAVPSAVWRADWKAFLSVDLTVDHSDLKTADMSAALKDDYSVVCLALLSAG